MALAIAISVFVFTTSLVLAYFDAKQNRQVVEARMRQYGLKKVSLYERQTATGLLTRFGRPLLEQASNFLSSTTPQQAKDKLRKQLMMAGNPGNLQASEFIAIKLLLSFGLGGILLLFRVPLFLVVGCALAGWIVPSFYLQSRVTQRVQAIAAALPDVLDLLTVSVEAGLGFDAAMAKVVEKSKGPLTEEFQHTLQEIRIGKPRRDAMRNLGSRTGVPDLQGFTAAIIQADQLGVGIGKVLRIQSAEIRRKRRQRAQEQAMKAPIKMLFPLVFFVFPALFIILLGPALLRFLEVF